MTCTFHHRKTAHLALRLRLLAESSPKDISRCLIHFLDCRTHFHAMFISSSAKYSFSPLEKLPSLKYICQDQRVKVANVRRLGNQLCGKDPRGSNGM